MNFKWLLVFILMFLPACTAGLDFLMPSLSADVPAEKWHAPLPHDGKVEALAAWWEKFDDPLLSQIILDAEKANPTLEQALARISQARATVRESRAALSPSLNAGASTTRGDTTTFTGIETTFLASFDAAWEIDLFGGQRRAVEAARAELAASQAGWHEARITLAAEVADAYVMQRACETLVDLYRQQLQSRQSTGALTDLKVQAGFTAPADSDLSAATLAETQSILENQKSLCAQNLNRLVYLTGIDALTMEQRLVQKPGQIPVPRSASVEAVPAVAIQQRPDIVQRERALAASSARIGVAEAERLPSLSLSGLIGINRVGDAGNSRSWSFGPAVTLPVFDAGRRRAAADRARAAYDENLAAYRQAVRQAVNEVEDALVRLRAVNARASAAVAAVEHYTRYFTAIESSHRAGAVNLFDLENARLQVYAARQTLISVQQEQAQAWIFLYKAVGGGWNRSLAIPDLAKTEAGT